MIDIQKFCFLDDTEKLKWLRNPWRADQGVVASNKEIMIVVPNDGGDYQSEPEQACGLVDRFKKKHIGSGEWVPVSSIGIPDASACACCGGRGRVITTSCNECDGSGDFIYKGRCYDCGKCMGYGYIVLHWPAVLPDGAIERLCRDCKGGREDLKVIAVGNSYFQRRYIAMLAELPDCVLSPDGMNAAPFKFTDGYGWLMPIVP